MDKSSKLEDKKVNSNVQNFAYSFRPIYKISRVFGLIPYIFYDKTGSIHRPRIRLSDFCWLIVSMSIYIGFAINCIRYANLPKKIDGNYVLTFSGYTIISLTLLFGAVLCAMDMCNRFKLVNIFQKINTFDGKV